MADAPAAPLPLDLSPLVSSHAASGFRGVSRTSTRAEGWRARVFDTRDRAKWRPAGHVPMYAATGDDDAVLNLGVFPTPHAAARALARWYFDRYGPRWGEAIRQMKGKPWRVRWSARLGGFVCEVWVGGVQRGLTYGECLPPRISRAIWAWLLKPQGFVWPTRAAGMAAIREFIRLHRPKGVPLRQWLWRPPGSAPRQAPTVTATLPP